MQSSTPPPIVRNWRRGETVDRDEAIRRVQIVYKSPAHDAALADGLLSGLLNTGWLRAGDWNTEQSRYETFTRPETDPQPFVGDHQKSRSAINRIRALN
jgi:hypothetical protein